jgi:hypothetical protein
VTDLLDEAIAVWRECPCQLPDFAQTSPAPTYGPEQQALHEREFDLFLQSVGAELSTVPGDRAARVAAQGRISSAFVRLASAGLDLTGAHLRLLLDGGFSAIGTQLGRQARRMQVPASVADIFQASRNAWTACGLQLLVGEEMRLSPSIFAYSMLYPATDNYLDASDISREEKIGFSLRFGRRLGGAEVSPANAHEREIWRLVAMIEEEHPRALRAPVYEGLLGIHQAQQESLRFQSRGSGGSEAELLSVSFNKGGASVVADALLASATLPPAVKRFAYFWGVFLQLADDLQDLREDLGGGALTLFTGAAGREPLDALTAKTLHFGSRVMRQMDGLPHGPVRSVDPGRGTDGADDGSDALKDLIRTSSRTVVVRSAGELAEFYSPEYLAGLECYSPCRFAFLRERRKQMAARRAATGRLFEAFLSGDDDEPAFPLLPSSLLPR